MNVQFKMRKIFLVTMVIVAIVLVFRQALQRDPYTSTTPPLEHQLKSQ